ncbi:MAG: hypothetical protein Kow00109_12080 [Acidobacteriota bacterium]
MRIFWRWLPTIIFLSVLALFLAGVGILLVCYTDAATAWFTRQVRSALESRFPVTVEVHSVQVRPFTQEVSIRDFCLRDARGNGGGCVVAFRRLGVRLSLLGFLRSGGLAAEEVELEGLHLTVREEENGRLNLANLFAPEPRPEPETGGERRWGLAVRNFRLRGAEVDWEDHRLHFEGPGGGFAVEMQYLPLQKTYRGRVRLQGFDLEVSNFLVPAQNIAAVFRWREGMVDFESVDFSGGGVMGKASGLLELRSPLRYEFAYLVDVVLPRLRSPELDEVVSEGLVKLEGTVSGEGGAVAGKAELSSPLLKIKGLPIEEFRGTVEFDRDTVHLAGGRFRLFDGEGGLEAEMPWKKGEQAAGTVVVRGMRLQPLLQNWEITGFPLDAILGLSAQAAWPSWQFPEIVADGEVEAAVREASPRIDTLPRLAGTIPVHLENQVVRFGEARLTSAATRLRGGGWVDFDGNLDLAAEIASGQALEVWAYSRAFEGPPDDFLLEYPVRPGGSFEGRVELELRRDEGLRLEAEASVAEVWLAERNWGRLEAQLELDPTGLRLTGTQHLTTGGSVDLAVGWSRPDWGLESFTGEARGVPVEIVAALGLVSSVEPVSGGLDAAWELVPGEAGWRGHGELRAAGLQVLQYPLEDAALAWSVAGQTWDFDLLRARWLGGSWTGSGRYAVSERDVAVSLRVVGLDVSRFALSEGPPLPAGAWEVRLAGEGKPEDLRWKLEGRTESLTWQGVGLEEVALNVAGERDRAEVVLSGRLEGAPVEVAGEIQTAAPYSFRLKGQAGEVSLTDLLRRIGVAAPPELSVIGSPVLAGEGSLEQLEAVRLDGVLNRLRIVLGEEKLAEARSLGWSWAGGRLTVSPTRMSGGGTDFNLEGWLDPAEASLSFKGNGKVDLQAVGEWLGRRGLEGTAEVQLNLFGSLERPRLVGECRLEGLKYQDPAFPVAIREGRGRLRFTADQVSIEDVVLTTQLGILEVSGGVFLQGLVPERWQVSVSGETLRLEYPEGLVSVVDAELDYVQGRESRLVTGTVRVRSAEYARDLTLPELILLFSSPEEVALPAEESGITLDVAVEAYRSLRVNNNLARLLGSAELRISGDLSHPVLLGTLTIDEGYVDLEDSRYEITRGTITFSDPRTTTPYFNLEAVTTVRDYDITVSARGVVEQLQLAFRSDPPLPTSGIITLLAAGQTPEEMFGIAGLSQGRTGSAVAFGAGTLLSKTLGNAVENQASRLLGFDRVSIDPFLDEAVSRDPGARISLGKQLTPRLNITYISSFASQFQEQGVVLEYTLTDWLTAVGTSRTDGTVSLDFKIRKRF